MVNVLLGLGLGGQFLRAHNRQQAGISTHGLLPAFHSTDNYTLHYKALRKFWKSMRQPVLAVMADGTNNAKGAKQGEEMREVLLLGRGYRKTWVTNVVFT